MKRTNLIRLGGLVTMAGGVLFAAVEVSVSVLVGGAWALVGYAVFRAGTRQTEHSSRVR